MTARAFVNVAIVVLLFAESHPIAGGQDTIAWSSSSRAGTVTFSADRQNVLLDANRSAGRPRLEVNLPGELFDSPVPLRTVTKTQATRDTPLHALEADRAAQVADDATWVLANFSSGDQAEVNRWLNDPGMRDANRAILRRQGQTQVVGWARLSGYLVAILKFLDGTPLPATLVREGGEWKRTNALSADLSFDIVFAATRAGTFSTAMK